METFPGIEIDPRRRFGKPCIAGTRVDVVTVVGAMAAGHSVERVAEEYALDHEQVLTGLRFAAHLVEHLPPTGARRS